MQRRAPIVTALLLTLLLVSCSGEERLKKQEFILQADEICGEFDDQVSEMRPPATAGEIQAFAEQIQQLMSDALTKLRELKPPADDAERVDAMLGNLETVTSLLPDLADAAAAQDLDKIQELNSRFAAEVNDFNESAEKYGMKTCASTSPSG
jgi:hypothetical protein